VADASDPALRSPVIWATGRLTIRAAFLLGFAVVFALWVASAYYLTRHLVEIEALTAATHARHDQGQELLLTVKAHVLLGSIHVRDALDEIDASSVSVYHQELHHIREEIDRALAQYLPDVDLPAEREHWSRLQAELDDYWNTMLPVLEWEPTRAAAASGAFLRTQVVPKREVIIEISDRIRALNEAAFRQERQQLDRLYGGARGRVWALNAIAVLLGLGIVVVAAGYAGRLESRNRQQHAEVLQNRRELQELSAQLVRAREDEQRTIARELHDEIGQVLTAIDVELAIAQRHSESSGKTAQSVAEARVKIERAIRTVQDLSELLHPATLDDFGLPDTLAWYLRGLSERTGIRTQLVQEGMDARLPSNLEVCTYRIIQEALTNIVRHAQATSCRIFLQRLPYSLFLTIEDDGKGFDPAHASASARRKGLGLVGIRERVAEFRGTLHVASSPGKGTRLTVELAIPAGEREAEAIEATLTSPPLPEEN
jgi:signal transduction histidine kinase